MVTGEERKTECIVYAKLYIKRVSIPPRNEGHTAVGFARWRKLYIKCLRFGEPEFLAKNTHPIHQSMGVAKNRSQKFAIRNSSLFASIGGSQGRRCILR